MKYFILSMALALGLQTSAQNSRYDVRDYGHRMTTVEGNLYKTFIYDSYDCEHLSKKNLRVRISMCTDRSAGNYIGGAALSAVFFPLGLHVYGRGYKLSMAAQRYQMELTSRRLD